MAQRVLLADPDPCLVRGYVRRLQEEGFSVTGVTDGLACVAVLRESPFCVLVLDAKLPWGGGDGVLALMAEEPDIPSTPVILLTDLRDSSVIYQMASFRIDDIQVKPLGGNRLAERIRGVMRHNEEEVDCEEVSG